MIKQSHFFLQEFFLPDVLLPTWFYKIYNLKYEKNLSFFLRCDFIHEFSRFGADAEIYSWSQTRLSFQKNGYAFTYREGEATTGNGWAYTNSIPAGVLGTAWDIRLRQM